MLTQLKVATRLIILSVFPILALIISFSVALNDMRLLNQNTDTMFNDSILPIRELKTVSDAFTADSANALRQFRSGQILEPDLQERLARAESEGNAAWERLLQANTNAAFQQADTHIKAVLDLQKKMLEEAASGRLRLTPLPIFNDNLAAAYDPLTASLNRLIDMELEAAAALRDRADAQYQRDRNMFIIVGTLVVLISGLLAWRISVSIQTPVKRLSETVQHISRDSNLTLRADIQGKDEIAELSRYFNSMMDHFQQLIKSLGNATDQLAAAAEEMSAISSQVSGGARDQEQQTTMIATAINQMTAAISEVASNAQSASTSAEQANEQAGIGLNRTHDTIRAIESLAESIDSSAERISNLDAQAERITEVLDVIEAIAEQTNLLALNAAIEAARAGDAGRGFAVVADEVRNLAGNTQQSTERIQQSISDLQRVAKESVREMQKSTQAARAGVDNARENGSTFEAMSTAVNRIMDMNVQISSATEEQTAVANDINENVHTVARIVSEVVSGADQTAEASQQLTELAQRLKAEVEQFKV
ncbi:Methyl-accepting chemotaxis protein [Nitrincola lacisaponensis]|uniref:Methyl-accepting chemotaxis protein n=1 Tax=Nitrincola lacisaponensis TaxID=267850 RepID=A0A063Y789_9GAMM|nr:methyl-accepting chemotaxis protein [Nitrincola lacisaponensis]KDE40297.1 Methyl-accepting chemotaxis protein [Nitrincola lacisaponensis]